MEKCSIFACESQPLGVDSVRRVCDPRLCGSASNWAAARSEIRSLLPNVVLLDNAAGYRQSALFLAELVTLSPRSAAALWVADLEETELTRSLQAGARGVIRRDQTIELLFECLRHAAEGRIWIEPELSGAWAEHSRRSHPALTPRERGIVELVTRGLKNREIAAELGITPGTVKVHLMHIFEKTAAKDRFDLALQSARILGSRQETEINSLSKRHSA